MKGAITIEYPIGGESSLTGQTRQALSTELYKLLGRRVLSSIVQEYNAIPSLRGEKTFIHGMYALKLTPETGIEVEHVRALVDELLIFHPGASLVK